MTGSGDALTVRGLARRFGRRWVIAGLDLDVPRGSALMVTGANGSGKTTLLRCLATALKPHRGTLHLFGQPAWDERAPLRARVALVSHATRLYDDLDAKDNLRIWASLGAYPVDPDALLRRVGLPTDHPEPVRAYSAGMRRRLALAIGLLKKPDLFLFDEPFAALDPAGRDMVASVMREERARGTTLVIATHLPTVTGPLCDRAVHLDAGKVAWSGSPKDAPSVEPEASA
jgi:heme ABC exporter ATP-binding subunit CcmA